MAKTDGKDNIVDDAGADFETVRRRRTRRGYHTGNPDIGGARDNVEVPATRTRFLQIKGASLVASETLSCLRP
eukprot:6467827-Amphidinium_carterae.1